MILDVQWDGDDAVITIPIEIIEQLGWDIGDVLSYKLVNGEIVLTKAKDGKPS